MGVKNLLKLIKEFAPDSLVNMPLTTFAGQVMAIDVSLAVYQWCAIGQTHNIKNADGKYINHIQGAFYLGVRLLTAGIKPLMIFDGTPPEAKAHVMAQRSKSRDEGTSLRVPREVFVEVASLFKLMGIQCLHAPSEAEAQAAVLSRDYTIGSVLTDDIDAIVFGARFMLKGMDSPHTVTMISRDDVLKGLGITGEQLVDLSILLGCDYAKTIKGIGPKTALKLIKQHGNLEGVVTALGMKKAITYGDHDYKPARDAFLQPLVAQNVVIDAIGKINGDALREFLVDVHKLVESRITKKLKSIV